MLEIYSNIMRYVKFYFSILSRKKSSTYWVFFLKVYFLESEFLNVINNTKSRNDLFALVFVIMSFR